MPSRFRGDEDIHDQPTQPIPVAAYWPDQPAASPAPPGADPAGRPAWSPRAFTVYRATRVVSYLTGLIQGLLLVRFAFRLIGANPAAPAVRWVYDLSHPFVFPFENLLPTPSAGPFALELYVLFALVFYAVVGLGLKRLLRLWLTD